MINHFYKQNLSKRHLGCLFLFCLLLGCVNPQPSHDEWNLARAAYRSAQESEARRHAPKTFAKAHLFLKKGERAYLERYYDEALEHFKKSRLYSERAETISRVNMFKQGEVAP